MSIESYILDGEGNPVAEPDTLKWGKWMQDAERRVAFDQVTPQVRVSTVFLGLNHSFGGDIPVLGHFAFPQAGEAEIWHGACPTPVQNLESPSAGVSFD